MAENVIWYKAVLMGVDLPDGKRFVDYNSSLEGAENWAAAFLKKYIDQYPNARVQIYQTTDVPFKTIRLPK